MTNLQKAHYEAIHNSYEQHYYDQTALDYRRRFVIAPFVQGIDLSNARIADIACGSGWNTAILRERFPQAQFHGYDISERACEDYRRNTGFEATCCDLGDMTFAGQPYDAAIVVGGLHHMVNDLPRATTAIAAMIRPGGHLLAYEPNRHFFLNGVREVWYRRDRYFEEESERALGLQELTAHFAGKLEPIDQRYLGGPAYMLILNSLVLRVPLGVKKPLAGILTAAELAYNSLPGRAAFPSFISRWRKL
jgi:SAM-dependent methyltransferase